jgi:hypothetical protein
LRVGIVHLRVADTHDGVCGSPLAPIGAQSGDSSPACGLPLLFPVTCYLAPVLQGLRAVYAFAIRGPRCMGKVLRVSIDDRDTVLFGGQRLKQEWPELWNEVSCNLVVRHIKKDMHGFSSFGLSSTSQIRLAVPESPELVATACSSCRGLITSRPGKAHGTKSVP